MKNVLVLFKKETGQRYIFLYDTRHYSEAMKTICDFAGDEDLDLTWKDASFLCDFVKLPQTERQ